MSDNTTTETTTTETTATEATATEATTTEATAPVETHEELSYHAVEKDGKVTAIWEMRGRKHVRTIDPRSVEGKHLLGHPEGAETSHNASA